MCDNITHRSATTRRLCLYTFGVASLAVYFDATPNLTVVN
jgi:hypothetical protein